MTVRLLAEIDGKTVPLAGCDYVEWGPCGCPFGVTLAGPGYCVTDDDAWKQFYPRKRDRERARKRGVRMELMTHERWCAEVADLMKGRCPHETTTATAGQE